MPQPNPISRLLLEARRQSLAARSAGEQNIPAASAAGSAHAGAVDPDTYAWRPAGLLNVTPLDGPFYLTKG